MTEVSRHLNAKPLCDRASDQQYKPAVQLMMASALKCPVTAGYFRESMHLGSKADFINAVVERLGRTDRRYVCVDDNLPKAGCLDRAVTTIDCQEGKWLGYWIDRPYSPSCSVLYRH